MNVPRTELSMRFNYALNHAFNLHRKQWRKESGVPYYSHLMAVASIVLDYGGDEDTAIAALLHDAVEDQGGMATHDAIRERCGERVASLVLALSDSVVAGEPKAPWEGRKAAYLARLRASAADVKLIAAADKLHNLRCTVADVRVSGRKAMAKFNAPADRIVAYYAACIAAIRDALPMPLAFELDGALDELTMLLALPASFTLIPG